TNVFKDKLRYPQITLEELIEKQPDYIFLSSEPYPFKEKHIKELQEKAPHLTSKMVLVDGEIFSWYGSRMLHADYFKQLVTELSIL
ncbi:MAG: cobalamin-binding protein, partial [Chitinophagaceae bacterium]|nr:cobalamin-binding protein [Chitinophagaceae bacterium]